MMDTNDMRSIDWLFAVAVCALILCGGLVLLMGEEPELQPGYEVNLSLDPAYAELNRDKGVWIGDDFTEGNLTVNLPEHPKGNITVYQGDRVVFQT